LRYQKQNFLPVTPSKEMLQTYYLTWRNIVFIGKR